MSDSQLRSLFCTGTGAYLSQRAVSLHSSGLDPQRRGSVEVPRLHKEYKNTQK